jgi:phage terminase small subunit
MTDDAPAVPAKLHWSKVRRPSGGAGGVRWSARKESFVAAIIEGQRTDQAAITAGYSKNGAKQAGFRLLNQPDVKAELEKRREAVRISNQLDLDAMVEQLQADREHALAHGQSMAAVRASETVAKLLGLLIERRDTRMVGGFSVQIMGIDD